MGVVEPFTRRLERYYRVHARIYDTTRWAFLFGRRELIERCAGQQPVPKNILEVGCGTGKNLMALANVFGQAQIVGMDLSAAMLARARHKLSDHGERIDLLQQAYGQDSPSGKSYDLLVFSYTLSMINPGWEQVIERAYQDLNPGGIIAVADFNDTRHGWFKRWMACNHVKMDKHLWPVLEARFQSLFLNTRPAYGGLWSYFLFIGEKT
ncbi:MAG: class I SAM-dependent methyltransferase [Gammaproteobacteria bacterium]|nr:class I SAM-dependent methyltransferase [Gammaproteobacteria bacterium]